jgi:hypothetical protein
MKTRHLQTLSFAMLFGACTSATTPSKPGASGGDTTTSCGTTNAASECEAAGWPRVAIAFGNPEAAAFTFIFRADDGFVGTEAGPCPVVSGMSSNMHCDVGFDGNPHESRVIVEVHSGDAGDAVVTRDVALTPFNYCGRAMVQLLVSTDALGAPTLSDEGNVDACGGL